MKIQKINNIKTSEIKVNKGFNFPKYKTTDENSFISCLVGGIKNAGKTNVSLNFLEIENHLLEKDNKVYWFSGTKDDKIKKFEEKYPNNFIVVGALEIETFKNVVETIDNNILEWKKKFRLVALLEKYLLKHKLLPEEIEELETCGYCENIEFENMNLEYPPISTIFIDDSLGSDLISGYSKNSKIFQKWFIAHRHHFTNIFIISQHLKSISRPLRVNMSLIIIFPMRSTDIYYSIFEEFSNLFKNKVDNFINLMNLIEDRKDHSFITIFQDKNKFVRINFDENVIF